MKKIYNSSKTTIMLKNIIEMMERFNYKVLLLFAVLSMNSCSDILDQAPLNLPDETTFWKTDNDAQLALTNLYKYLPDYFQWWTECYTDNAIMTNAWGEGGLGEIKQGNMAATTSHIQPSLTVNYGAIHKWSPWRYDHIEQILYYLENIKKVNFSSTAVKNNMEGQARFILALRYFRITCYFGDIPLIKEKPVSLEESRNLTRSPQKEVFDYILENVNKAIEYLPDTHDKTGKITRDAAYMLKADILIWMASYSQYHNKQLSDKTSSQLWREAANAAQKVIKSGHYILEPDIVTLFQSVQNNKDDETILARQYVKDEVINWFNVLGVPGGCSLRGGGWASFSAPRGLIDDFECTDGKSIFESPTYNKKSPWENRDKRLTSWFLLPKYPVIRANGKYTLFESHPSYSGPAHQEAIGGEGGGGRSGYWGIKYVEMNTYDSYGYQNWKIYRYGETLLMLAEALNECNSSNDSIVWAMNQIRTRAGLPGVDALKGNQIDMRKKIWHERRIELENEDKRFYDLYRTKQAEVAMNPTDGVLYGINLSRDDYDNALGDWTKAKIIAEPIKFDVSKGYLWPIPQEVMDNNPKITQNPNW